MINFVVLVSKFGSVENYITFYLGLKSQLLVHFLVFLSAFTNFTEPRYVANGVVSFRVCIHQARVRPKLRLYLNGTLHGLYRGRKRNVCSF